MIRLFVLILLLTGCTASTPTPMPTPRPTIAIIMPTAEPEPTPTPALITAQAVVDMFIEAGLEVSDVHIPESVEGSPLPNSFDERLGFAVAEVAPKGGQVFTCRNKPNCDALYAYFDVLKGIGGPYYYQSAGGTVVAQMNSGLTPDTAERFQEIVEGIE